MIKRKMTRQISIGDVKIGGGAPISVQSMTNTKTTDTNATVAQIKALVDAGCDIVRVAVPDMSAAENIYNIKSQVDVPLVADIHFDYRLALKAIEQGIDALRINPGNIGDEERVKAVVEAAKIRNIPIRIGVNAGSLDKKLLAKYGKVTAEALVESALEHIRILEKLNFYDIKISFATFTSFTGSPVKEMRNVSPMPSASKAPIPTADLIIPVFTVPASVMPK